MRRLLQFSVTILFIPCFFSKVESNSYYKLNNEYLFSVRQTFRMTIRNYILGTDRYSGNIISVSTNYKKIDNGYLLTVNSKAFNNSSNLKTGNKSEETDIFRNKFLTENPLILRFSNDYDCTENNIDVLLDKFQKEYNDFIVINKNKKNITLFPIVSEISLLKDYLSQDLYNALFYPSFANKNLIIGNNSFSIKKDDYTITHEVQLLIDKYIIVNLHTVIKDKGEVKKMDFSAIYNFDKNTHALLVYQLLCKVPIQNGKWTKYKEIVVK